MNIPESQIKQILQQYQKITVLGLSPDPSKASHRIPLFMHSKNYDVVGIYPNVNKVAHFTIYQNLKDVPPDYRKFVDVFRRPEHIPQVVDEILAVGGVEVLWLQLGITHPEAEIKAEAAGIKVISNRCLLVEYQKYLDR